MILLFSLTCLIEQKEKDEEGGRKRIDLVVGFIVDMCGCVSVCAFQQRGYIAIFWEVNIPDIYYSGTVMN